MSSLINFETLAIQEFPEIVSDKKITRKQVNQVVEKHKCRYPSHIFVPQNNISRGVFKFEYSPSESDNYVAPKQETDKELDTRIRDTYRSIETLINAVAKGVTPSLIISGAPGLGKSYTVEKVLTDNNQHFVFHRGYIKSTHLFRLLWENREKGQTIVLDDTDSIFDDLTALNLLKAALELKESKLIGWGSEKEMEDSDGEVIPRYFMYQGSIIFLTNINFSDSIKNGNKLAPHLAAIDSRSIQLDMNIRTPREIFCRLTQVINESDINEKRGITDKLSKDMLDFMQDNLDRCKEISIRSYEKLSALVIADPLFWKPLAERVMLR